MTSTSRIERCGCGGGAALYATGRTEPPRWFVRCKACGNQTGFLNDPERAVRFWNDRRREHGRPADGEARGALGGI